MDVDASLHLDKDWVDIAKELGVAPGKVKLARRGPDGVYRIEGVAEHGDLIVLHFDAQPAQPQEGRA